MYGLAELMSKPHSDWAVGSGKDQEMMNLDLCETEQLEVQAIGSTPSVSRSRLIRRQGMSRTSVFHIDRGYN